MVEKAGCCGAAELIKLYAFSMVGFHRVVLLDMDSMVAGCLEDLFEHEEELLFTHDMGMCSTCERGSADRVPPYQGGFFIVRPSVGTFAAMVAIVRRGNFVERGPKLGWEGTGIGYYWGGRTIQGLFPYYYTHVAPERSKEVPICTYNNMGDSDECKRTPVAEVRNAHFTVCQKPWYCARIADPTSLCAQLVEKWFALRRDFEQRLGLAPAQRMCDTGRYQPIQWPEHGGQGA